MAIESSLAVCGRGARDVGPDSGYDGRAEGHVGDEMPVHDVDVEPVVCIEG